MRNFLRVLFTPPPRPLPRVNADTPGFKKLERETRRLQAIAFLGDRWVLAKTRQDVIARVQGLA